MLEIVDSIDRIDFDRVHAWLSETYWSPGVAREKVERAARHSASVIGAFSSGVQVGYCRVVSDQTTFAWLCDVIVDEAARGQGIGRAMVEFALALPQYEGIRRWVLATRDAQGVYAPLGFEVLPNPERWMIRSKIQL